MSRAAFSLEKAQWGLIHVDRYLKGGCPEARAGLCSAVPRRSSSAGQGTAGHRTDCGLCTPRLVPSRSQCLGTRARPGNAGVCRHRPLIQVSG